MSLGLEGIPSVGPSFIVFQLVGGVVAIGVIRVLYPDITPEEASEIMLPQDGDGNRALERT
jgi:hypothetical protein